MNTQVVSGCHVGGHYSTERSGTERNSSVTLFYGTEPVPIPHDWRANIALCVELLRLLVVVLAFMLEVTKKNVKNCTRPSCTV